MLSRTLQASSTNPSSHTIINKISINFLLYDHNRDKKNVNWVKGSSISLKRAIFQRFYATSSDDAKKKESTFDKPTLFVSLLTVTGLVVGYFFMTSMKSKSRPENSSSTPATPFANIIYQWSTETLKEPTTQEEKKLWRNAIMLMQEMRYQQAVNVLANLARRYQKPIYLSKLASCYDAMGDKEKAQAALESLLFVLPEDAILKAVVGEWLIVSNKKEDALRVLQEAKTPRLPLKLLPMVVMMRAELLAQSKQYSEALKELSEAIEATKSTNEIGSEFFMKVASSQLLIELNKYKEASDAIESLEKAHPVFAKNPLLLRTKATGLWLQGKSEEAKTLFSELLKSPDGDIYYEYGRCLMSQQQWAEALGYLEKAQQSKPKNTFAVSFKIAQCKKQLGKYDEALKELENAGSFSEVEELRRTIKKEMPVK